jgi:hypothetical protein
MRFIQAASVANRIASSSTSIGPAYGPDVTSVLTTTPAIVRRTSAETSLCKSQLESCYLRHLSMGSTPFYLYAPALRVYSFPEAWATLGLRRTSENDG